MFGPVLTQDTGRGRGFASPSSFAEQVADRSVQQGLKTLLLATFTALALTACGPSKDKATPNTPSDEATDARLRAPLPAGDADAPDIAADNCIGELASTAVRPTDDILIVHIIANERVVVHYLMLEGADALWACRTDPSGQVLELTYTAEG